jgi:16S rRNA (guanine527-N7)-methyltransferase
MSGAEGPRALLEVLEHARSLDLLGPMALDQQVDHALGFAHAFAHARADDPIPGRWLDLGSGGGLPGLVLAEHWPTTPAVLLDASERRTTFLSEAVLELGWVDRVQVVRARISGPGSTSCGHDRSGALPSPPNVRPRS